MDHKQKIFGFSVLEFILLNLQLNFKINSFFKMVEEQNNGNQTKQRIHMTLGVAFLLAVVIIFSLLLGYLIVHSSSQVNNQHKSVLFSRKNSTESLSNNDDDLESLHKVSIQDFLDKKKTKVVNNSDLEFHESSESDLSNSEEDDNIDNVDMIFHKDLNPEQRKMIKKLRNDLSGNFTKDFMNSSRFLYMWLNEKNWDYQAAKQMLIEHLEFRIEYKIDLDEETFSQLEGFKAYTDGVDKENRPVISGDISSWDLRKAALAGRGNDFVRFVFREYELCAKLIRDSQTVGLNVTQIIIIYNLEGFNMIQHGCYHCIPYYMKTMLGLEDNYPGMLYKLILINTPVEFEFFLSLAPESIERNMEVYGANKAQWKKAILQRISPEQIRPQFGGTKLQNSDIDD